MKNLPVFLLLFFIISPFVFAEQTGYASWYADKFHGRKTANGEIFDTYKFTAAHKNLPFDTVVRVRNLENGKTAIVRINDRGPFVEGRIIDLSYAAAQEIGIIDCGVAKVSIDIIEGDGNKAENFVYKIQIGAYSNVKNAENIILRLNSNGLNPTMEKTDKGIFRVVLADLEENDIARCQELLKKSGFADYILKKEIKL